MAAHLLVSALTLTVAAASPAGWDEWTTPGTTTTTSAITSTSAKTEPSWGDWTASTKKTTSTITTTSVSTTSTTSLSKTYSHTTSVGQWEDWLTHGDGSSSSHSGGNAGSDGWSDWGSNGHFGSGGSSSGTSLGGSSPGGSASGGSSSAGASYGGGYSSGGWSYSSGNSGGNAAIVSAPAPIHTLTPGFLPSHNDQDLSHLKPGSAKDLFFAQGAPNSGISSGSLYVSAGTTFQYPTVVLDHSAFVTATVSGSSLTVVFSSQQAYNYATKSWPADGTWFVLATTEGSDDGHYVYYLTSSVSFDSTTSTATCNVKAVDLNYVAESFDLEWGTYQQSSSTRATGSASMTVSYAGSGGSYSTTSKGYPGSGATSTTSAAATSLPTGTDDSDTFDQQLDDALGYIVWEQSDFQQDLSEFAGGLDDYNWDDYDDDDDYNDDDDGIFDDDGDDDNSDADVDIDTDDGGYFEQDSKKRSLRKRATTTRSRSNAVVSDIRKKGAAASKDQAAQKKPSLKDKLLGFAKKVVSKASDIKSWVDGSPHEYQMNKTFTIPNATQVKYVQQDFFKDDNDKPLNAIKIWENDNFHVYCVSCGVTGTLKVAGRAAFHITKGLTMGQLEMLGNLEAGVNLGVAAEVNYGDKKSVRLFTQGIPGLSVPNIITIGPYITLDAEAGFTFNATGQILVGGTVKVANARAVIDLVNSGNSQTPTWQPQFEPTFKAKGEIIMDTYVALPIGLAFGLDIANSKFTAEVAVTSVPSLHAGATFQAEVSLSNGTLSGGVNSTANGVTNGASTNKTCNGINFYINLQHDLKANAVAKLFGKEKYKTKDKQLLSPYKLNLASKCLTLSGIKKRQSDNTTTTDDSYDYDSDSLLTLSQYADGTDPFPDIDVDVDGDGDGVDDEDEYDFPSLVSAYLNDTSSNFTTPLDLDDSVQSGPEYNYTIISDTGLLYNLAADDEGNVRIQDIDSETFGSALFQVFDEVVVGDSEGRTLFYYSPEMSNYGVSRLRLGDSEHIPISSEIVGLVPFLVDDETNDGALDSVFVAMDTQGNEYWTVLCNYADGNTASKVFLVQDFDAGLDTLKNATLEQSVTGGAISECVDLPLTNGLAGL
ncbi:uncharacterized protein PV07_09705 [Cladophialophora immunda]|uniref:Peptidase A1 domain-containing protein n=1 Tax=Cladophialophora immunda TaxID=569365 RepID=A0A0D1Z8J0_9EURO|nr:uncharacterized protein PV07_09705 [Cladophialophora immunda]KIW23961.1 hypothetical protein PV07_09705 [Cladophialophora immunda]OQV08293.1 hypothetical protein CLAIMM_12594 [Cladophialophora immunda]